MWVSQSETLSIAAIAGVGSAAGLALLVGFRQYAHTRTLSDLLPVRRGGRARVKTQVEFSSTTVASTISLATLILAYYELAATMGLWLLWTVVTTAIGILGVRVVANRIWEKLRQYGTRIPTLHEFLGTEYQSSTTAFIGAIATSLGYLGAFAVELTVGSRLFAGLIPHVPTLGVVIVLAMIGLLYTSAGGFRAVVITDRIQMVAIWVFIAAFTLHYAMTIAHARTSSAVLGNLPQGSLNFSMRPGLIPFLAGVAVMNIPIYVADMGMWQRVTSTTTPSYTTIGLVKSAASASLSWGLLAMLAILAPAVARSPEGVNPLLPVLWGLAAPATWLSVVILFLAIVGLYAAMMSTASTLLIVVSHTFYEDIIARWKSASPEERAESSVSLRWARGILVLAAIVSIAIVEILARAGFSIADFVFAIFGAQLGLFPAVYLALSWERSRLRKLSTAAVWSIGSGFIMGWVSALSGKLLHVDNLVFLAPVVSLTTSSLSLGIGVYCAARR